MPHGLTFFGTDCFLSVCKTRTTDRASRQLLLMLHCKLLVHQKLFSISFTTTDLHPGEGQVREEENTRTFKVSDHCRGGLIAKLATTGGRYRGTVPPNERSTVCGIVSVC
jgi:hypothetical protein